jgi:hypothetical protein
LGCKRACPEKRGHVVALNKLNLGYWHNGHFEVWCLLFSLILLFSYINVSIFCFNSVLSIITIALLLSALAIVKLLCCNIFFIWFILCWCLLCNVLCLLDSFICLIFLAVKYRNVFCMLLCKCLMAFSVSIINSLIQSFGFFSIAYCGPSFNVLICSLVKVMLVRFITLLFSVCMFSLCLFSFFVLVSLVCG